MMHPSIKIIKSLLERQTYFSVATVFTVGTPSMVLTCSNKFFMTPMSLDFREVKLSVVSYLTNSIVDQILQELYATHKTLVLQTDFSLHSSVHSEHVHKHRSSSRICSSSQLRQVSQMRRLEDGGTARRTHRHADILDVVEDDFGISIVSVLRESLN